MNSYGAHPTLPPNNAHQKYKPYSSVSSVVHAAERSGGSWPARAQRTSKEEGYGFLCLKQNKHASEQEFVRRSSNVASQQCTSKIQTLQFSSVLHVAERSGGSWPARAQRTWKEEGYGFLCLKQNKHASEHEFVRRSSNAAAQQCASRIQTLQSVSQSVVHAAERSGGSWPSGAQRS
jgi:hypothetical protein